MACCDPNLNVPCNGEEYGDANQGWGKGGDFM